MLLRLNNYELLKLKLQKMKNFSFTLLFICFSSLAQEAEMTIRTGIQDEDLKLILDFENTQVDELEFRGQALQNKYYVARLKEYKEGELVETTTLFDERGNGYFKVDTSFTSFKFLSKIDRDELKIWIRGKRFGSKQSFFELDSKNGRYVVKDFLGSKTSIDVPTYEPFYIFAVITPNRSANGTGSYCRVAQSDIAPEQFGKEFNIPHYFLVEMEFIEEDQAESAK